MTVKGKAETNGKPFERQKRTDDEWLTNGPWSVRTVCLTFERGYLNGLVSRSNGWVKISNGRANRSNGWINHSNGRATRSNGWINHSNGQDGQLSADGFRNVADESVGWPSADSWPTVSRLLVTCRWPGGNVSVSLVLKWSQTVTYLSLQQLRRNWKN